MWMAGTAVFLRSTTQSSFNRNFLPSRENKQIEEDVNPFSSVKGSDSVVISDVREYKYEDNLGSLALVHCHQGNGEAEYILWSSLSV